jgi:hypothetical protein
MRTRSPARTWTSAYVYWFAQPLKTTRSGSAEAACSWPARRPTRRGRTSDWTRVEAAGGRFGGSVIAAPYMPIATCWISGAVPLGRRRPC